MSPPPSRARPAGGQATCGRDEPRRPDEAGCRTPGRAGRRQPPRTGQRRADAREVATTLDVGYDEQPHDVVLTPSHPKLYAPEKVNPAFPTDTETGDVETALASAPVVLDRTYSTPAEFNNPMEPHATTAFLGGRRPNGLGLDARDERRARRPRQPVRRRPRAGPGTRFARRRRVRRQGQHPRQRGARPPWPPAWPGSRSRWP